MACQLNRVGNDAVVSNGAIMRHMDIGHDQAIASYFCFKPVGSTTADSGKFPDYGIISNDGGCLLAGKFEVLRQRRDDGTGKYLDAFANSGSVHNYSIGPNPTVVADFNISANCSERLNFYIFTDPGIRMNIG